MTEKPLLVSVPAMALSFSLLFCAVEANAAEKAQDGEERVAIRLSPHKDAAGKKAARTDAGQKELSRLLAMSESGAKKERKEEAARERLLREAGETVAFQQGFRWQYDELAREAESLAPLLDSIFPFEPLLIEGKALPPVILKAGPAVKVTDEGLASSVEASYRIEAPARFVAAPPTWRDYLLQTFDAFPARQEFLPKTSGERAAWKEAVEAGWKAGREHAFDTFLLNIRRLTADYRGMLLFRSLAQRSLVSLPQISEGHTALRAGKKSLDVNETVFRIALPAEFLQAEERRDAELRKGGGR